FQAADGIRARNVTGVQTCALPIWNNYDSSLIQTPGSFFITGTLEGTSTTVSVTITMLDTVAALLNYSAAVQVDGAVTLPSSRPEIGRASCRERVYVSEGAGAVW